VSTEDPTRRVRAPRGEVIRKTGKRGVTFALRFTAYGERRYVTLGRADEGWTEQRASDELHATLAAVRAGSWQPHRPVPPAPEAEPTFHEFASAWFEANRGEWRESTRLDYEWQLSMHLLPFFKDHLLSEITVAEVDRYRETKVAENARIAARRKSRMHNYLDRRGRRCRRPERPLSAASINKTITRLGQVLEVAVERDLIPRNPARVGGKRRRLKADRPARVYLDRAEQIAALLNAARELDVEAQSNRRINRRALLATLIFAGLRIGELIALDWRDVDLAGGRLRVRASKTEAGVRYVDLLPVLASELRALKATVKPDPTDPVFASAAGTRLDRNRVRARVLRKAVERADVTLLADGHVPLPAGLTLHALRRTFASVLVALGRDPAYVMAQIGHTSPTVTLAVYAQAMHADGGHRDQLRQLTGMTTVVVTLSDGAAERSVARRM
jgi:integrase